MSNCILASIMTIPEVGQIGNNAYPIKTMLSRFIFRLHCLYFLPNVKSFYLHDCEQAFRFVCFVLVCFDCLFDQARLLGGNYYQGWQSEKFSFLPGCPFLYYSLMDAKAAASAKPGLEESVQSTLHRIRITLTSTKVKALEQGN